MSISMNVPFAYKKSRVLRSQEFATFAPLHTDAKGEEFFSLLTVHGHQIGDEFSFIPDIFHRIYMYLEETDQLEQHAEFIQANRLRLIPFQRDVYFLRSQAKKFALPTLTITSGDFHTDRVLYGFIAGELSFVDCGMNSTAGFHVPKLLLQPLTARFQPIATVPTPL